MEKYVLTSGQTVIKYPIYPHEFHEYIGESPYTIQILVDAGIYRVFPVEKGTSWNKNYTESHPTWTGDRWVESWVESDATQEEIAERTAYQWTVIRKTRNRLLADTDWTQFADVPLDTETKQTFADYRQQLRDITEQPDPFDIWFPEVPNA